MSRSAQDRVRDYFRVKTQQLVAGAALPAAEHAGLAGSHREELQRLYLAEVLPQRYGVGRGMVYGITGRSREADIVIWDALNYPRLPMLDHSFYFAESVRTVIESKSRWSQDDFKDVLEKSKAVRDIVPTHSPSLDDAVAMLQLEVASLRDQRPHSGFLSSRPHIGTAAIFLAGGKTVLADGKVPDEVLPLVDDVWPDALLLLEPGRLVLKEYTEDKGGQLLFFELGPDALIAFTNALLRLIADRSVLTEGPFYLEGYAFPVLGVRPFAVVDFKLLRWAPCRTPLWGD